MDEPKRKQRAMSSEHEEDSIAWDLLRAGAYTGRMAGKAAYLGARHVAWPVARGAASMAWRAFVPADRDTARGPDGAPSQSQSVPPQPTPGSSVPASEGFRSLAITNGEAPQQPIAWPRVSEVYRARIVGKQGGTAGVGMRDRFIGPGDPGYEHSLGIRGRSPPSNPPSRPPSRPPSEPPAPTRRRMTGKRPGADGYPPS